jgi:hypothetical protein
MKKTSNNIVSASPNRSPGSESSSANQSIGDYIKKVFRKPRSSTSLSSSSSSHACTWELPPPLASSVSGPSSSFLSSNTTSSTHSSSSSSSERESDYSECRGDDSCDDLSTEEWFNHRLAKKKTRRCVVARYKTLGETGFSPRAFGYLLTVTFLRTPI